MDVSGEISHTQMCDFWSVGAAVILNSWKHQKALLPEKAGSLEAEWPPSSNCACPSGTVVCWEGRRVWREEF